MKVKRKFTFELLVLGIILILATYFRLYNFTGRISMGLDSARDAFVSSEGAKNLQIPITGPFISIAPVTTGPWYWIQLIIAHLIIPGAYAPWLLLAGYSLFEVWIMYKIGSILENKWFGCLLALIAAVSPNQISTAVQLTNPSVIGFYSSIVVLIFLLILKKGENKKLGFLWGLILGITINTHYQSAGLMTLPLLLLIYRKKYLKTLLYMAVGIAITFIPTLIFELSNHWYNTRHMWQYLTIDQYKIWVPMRWLTYIKNFWPEFLIFVFGGTPIFGTIIMCFIGLVLTWMFFAKKLASKYLLLGISFVVMVIIIRYYRGERFFGYLQFFHPFLFIFLGLSLWQFLHRKWGYIFASILLISYLTVTIPSSISRQEPESLTTITNQQVNQIYSKFGPGPFKIYKCNYLVKGEIVALMLALDMQGKYSLDGKSLAYFWGCDYPKLLTTGQMLTDNDLQNAEKYYPSVDLVKDFSLATPSAMFAWSSISPKEAYQSAARWWMDEQP